MAKIAQIDNEAMNSLYKLELAKHKIAAGTGPEDPQAFKDHEEMIKTLEDVLSQDKKTSWKPNDPKLD